MLPVQTKKEILNLLWTNRKKLADLGLRRVGLFGSFVRNEQKEDSDVDILVEFVEGKKKFKNFMQSVYFLEELFGRETEMLTLESVAHFIKPYILREVEFVMIPSLIEFLKHIQTEIDYLLNDSVYLNYEKFLEDETRKRAYTRSLEVIGEAIKNLDMDFRQRFPQIDWKSYAGLRDKLIHHYFGVDYEIIWEVIKQELPEIQGEITRIILLLEQH